MSAREFRATARFGDGTFSLCADVTEAEHPGLYRSDRLVLDTLADIGPATVRSIIGRSSLKRPETARRAVYRLARMGLIRRVDSGGKGAEATYAKA
jgi:hypothetical protein